MTGLAEMQRDAKEPRGVNHVLAPDAGTYFTQGFPAAVNAHLHMPMAFPGTVVLNYIFKQVGF
jgi:hypothetical protein